MHCFSIGLSSEFQEVLSSAYKYTKWYFLLFCFKILKSQKHLELLIIKKGPSRLLCPFQRINYFHTVLCISHPFLDVRRSLCVDYVVYFHMDLFLFHKPFQSDEVPLVETTSVSAWGRQEEVIGLLQSRRLYSWAKSRCH